MNTIDKIALSIVVSLIIAIAIIAYTKPEDTCESYKDYQLRYLPVRCLEYYGIAK